MEEETGEYVHVEGEEPVQEYNYHEHLQQDPEPEPELEEEHEPEEELEPEVEGNSFEEGTPFEEPSPVLPSAVTAVQEPQISAEEPYVEPEKLTYASIVSFILVLSCTKSYSVASSLICYVISRYPEICNMTLLHLLHTLYE